MYWWVRNQGFVKEGDLNPKVIFFCLKNVSIGLFAEQTGVIIYISQTSPAGLRWAISVIFSKKKQ